MITERKLGFRSDIPCVVALGCFDGIHAGHRRVLSEAVGIANKMGVRPAVFSFSRPPKSLFVRDISLIDDVHEKLSLFESLGIGLCVCPDPTPEILSVSAEDFINSIIIEGFSPVHVVCGYNYSFGKGAQGNVELLRTLCAAHGIGVTVIDEYLQGGKPVSSSLIRELISNGKVEDAADLLCRPFSVSDRVVDGQHLARRLGFPTLNIVPSPLKLLPLHGVYAVRIILDGREFYGIANVGLRPTVDVGIRCVEAHIFDFSEDIYGKTVTVEFLHFLREERRFESIELLQAQVLEDIERAKSAVSQYK